MESFEKAWSGENGRGFYREAAGKPQKKGRLLAEQEVYGRCKKGRAGGREGGVLYGKGLRCREEGMNGLRKTQWDKGNFGT